MAKWLMAMCMGLALAGCALLSVSQEEIDSARKAISAIRHTECGRLRAQHERMRSNISRKEREIMWEQNSFSRIRPQQELALMEEWSFAATAELQRRCR